MDKTSTRTSTSKPADRIFSPSKKTIDFLRQFARIYTPVSNMPGVVLN